MMRLWFVVGVAMMLSACATVPQDTQREMLDTITPTIGDSINAIVNEYIIE